ncbi:MAG: hypothetical protein M5U01_37265 [Ardenticatenaceae bacterium]|nr:hypothetical protein [Ardenticatenaceae bacterium]
MHIPGGERIPSDGGSTCEGAAHPIPHTIPRQRKSRASAHHRTVALLLLVTLLLGLGGFSPLNSRLLSTVAPDRDPAAHASLVNQINPPDGYPLPASLGTIGRQLLAAGAIDEARFLQVYAQSGRPLTETQLASLRQGSDAPIVINRENAYFLLNFFWAFGLTNQNPVLTEGPLIRYSKGQIERFASTGGWTLGTRPVTALYASIPVVALRREQQARLEAVAETVHRPCCDNPTAFPDCDHGMALLGLLELMASRDASIEEMYQAARYVNAFWFPEQSLELAIFFKMTRGLDFADADARQLSSADFSSATGSQRVHQWLATNGLLEQPFSESGSCGV